ncbi:MAG: SH3 domain-containing protein [Lawsonibacter sp.]|jgi:hypothetical protein
MAERNTPSRRVQSRSSTSRQTSSRHSASEKQSTNRRNDVIHCENCGEDYSVTYKRCPFCDERPGRTGIGGRRVAEHGYGPSVHPVQVIGLVISLVLIIAALFIVFKYMGPLLFGSKQPTGSSSINSSQGTGEDSSQTQPDGSVSTPDGSTSSGNELPEPDPQPDSSTVTVDSITLSRTEFTLKAGEEYQLGATVSPAGAEVAWSSSDPNVVTVDSDGIVKNVNASSALKKATITATAGDKSVECVVFCRGSGTDGSSSESGGAPSGTTSGPVAANTPGTISNAGSGLNVRSGPGSTYDKVASIKNGDKITILEDTGSGWYKIDYGGGKTGYVSSDYVTVGG